MPYIPIGESKQHAMRPEEGLNYLGQAGGNLVKNEGSVHLAVSTCVRELDHLDKALSALRERLEPVLRQTPPNPEKGKMATEAPYCSLAREIEEQGMRIAVLRGWVEDMLSRLGL